MKNEEPSMEQEDDYDQSDQKSRSMSSGRGEEHQFSTAKDD